MTSQQEQHDPPPNPETPPILDYHRPHIDDITLLGQPLRKTIGQLLTIQLVLMFLASLMLDAGAMMLMASVFFLVCWIGLSACLLFNRIRPPLRLRILIIIGIALAAAGPFLT